ncbi:MAG: transcriptional regulator NrdR [Clostridiales bacterium]|nr:transcriptional regulator NrdR [Clostridiales bacterium]MDD7433211.1 transcriptional regulator NrdR [Clostridiales bacterium]MDY3061713.1 transcriptional regulator NrdR [Eubacteriales bacterium]
MKCPYCGYIEDKVIDSRPTEDHLAIRRRRECLSCHERFTTYEKQEELPLFVIKRDGSRQPFDREKLIQSIMKSCVKRPVTTAQIEKLVDTLERNAMNQLKREISSREIGEQVLAALGNLDDVAYVRFASVYRDFDNVESFLSELHRLQSVKVKKHE